MDTVSAATLPPGDANEREIMLMHVMMGHTARACSGKTLQSCPHSICGEPKEIIMCPTCVLLLLNCLFERNSVPMQWMIGSSSPPGTLGRSSIPTKKVIILEAAASYGRYLNQNNDPTSEHTFKPGRTSQMSSRKLNTSTQPTKICPQTRSPQRRGPVRSTPQH